MAEEEGRGGTTPPEGEGGAPGGEAQADSARREALYDRYAERARQLFESGQERGREAMEKALGRAREQLAEAGEFTAEQGEVFQRYLRRDLEQTMGDMRELGEEARERLNPSRLGAGALSSLAGLLGAAGQALSSLSRRAEAALHFRTGEITSAGTLTCARCGKTLHLRKTAHVPPCPSCSGTEFRKGY